MRRVCCTPRNSAHSPRWTAPHRAGPSERSRQPGRGRGWETAWSARRGASARRARPPRPDGRLRAARRTSGRRENSCCNGARRRTGGPQPPVPVPAGSCGGQSRPRAPAARCGSRPAIAGRRQGRTRKAVQAWCVPVDLFEGCERAGRRPGQVDLGTIGACWSPGPSAAAIRRRPEGRVGYASPAARVARLVPVTGSGDSPHARSSTVSSSYPLASR